MIEDKPILLTTVTETSLDEVDGVASPLAELPMPSKAPRIPTKDEIALLPLFSGLGPNQVTLVSNEAEAANALAVLLAEQALGFDTESKPTFKKGEVSDGPHVVQFSTLSHGYVFQLHHSFSVAVVMQVMASVAIRKFGFGLKNDMSQIAQKLGLTPKSVVDLDQYFKRLRYRQTIGAKTAIAILFAQRFVKSKSISTTNWSNKQLTEKQVLYAANDAYAAIRAFHALAALTDVS